MLPKSLLLIAAAAAVSAFTVDPNAADGVYIIDAEGKHSQIYNATAADVKRSADGFAQGDSTTYVRRGLGARSVSAGGCDFSPHAPLSKDPICQADTKDCEKGEYTNHADVDNANRMLADQLNALTKATYSKPHVYSIAGNAVAYFCILQGQDDAQGDSGSQKRALERITAECGLYYGGDLTTWNGWDGAGGITYGWRHKDQSFCGY